MFVAHVAHCFPEELRSFPQQIIDILKRYATVLNPEVNPLDWLETILEFFFIFGLLVLIIYIKNRLYANVLCSFEIKI